MECSILHIVHASSFSLRFASEGHFWGQSLARGSTPLHYAANNGRVEVVKLLVEAKASVIVKDDKGRVLDWEMWWVFDGFCLLLLLCLINRYYFVAAVLFVEH